MQLRVPNRQCAFPPAECLETRFGLLSTFDSSERAKRNRTSPSALDAPP
jgi:hypothetical protein